ncbi:MAG: T9SS type A sorting domain-containing protein [Bacteroidia bacterium]|nr:T9SS type A sorting domain-containing protein [Bacteroidia bacterium]MCF8427553.1 T9SS type A sorting domain-containing protein [Bacteroidia bacterium]MCF8447898.1 T9SS type A sorting domain-containing protein [Bacteroidia bacterium]
MKRFLFLFSVLLGFMNAQSQTISPNKICDLPEELNETSGLIKIGPNKFLTHNDSGNEPIIYVFDSSGTINRRIRITNATNIDWEDITMDAIGNIWVGDFGNNDNSRQNLRIYKIASPNTFTKDSVVASVTSFTYSDQKEFPPAVANQNFDLEGFFWYNDSLYLFSKNRSNPYSGYTKCYQLPAKSSTLVAKLIDSVYTGTGSYFNSSVTGAAIYPNANKMIMGGYEKIWVFSNFTGHNFFKGNSQVLSYPTLTQKEGYFFENANSILFTQESSVLGPTGFFRVAIPNYQPTGLNEKKKVNLQYHPNPVSDKLILELPNYFQAEHVTLEIINCFGLNLKTIEMSFGSNLEIDVRDLPNGIYFIRAFGLNQVKFIKE